MNWDRLADTKNVVQSNAKLVHKSLLYIAIVQVIGLLKLGHIRAYKMGRSETITSFVHVNVDDDDYYCYYYYYWALNMKQYILSDDRVVVVKKMQGQQSVVIKQKDSDVKFAELTPNR